MSEIGKAVLRASDVPFAAAGGCARIEIMGNREALVDGCRGVAEYGDTLIKLNISGGSVYFTGEKLEITCLYRGEATVRGNIRSVEFRV